MSEIDKTQALLSALEAYDLTDDDRAELAGYDPAAAPGHRWDLPTVAVVGRPNVGKSTLINRILGHRAAVVQDTPGVTRDRVRYEAEWNGKRFTLVDTGGWEKRVHGLDLSVAQQSEAAMDEADIIFFVVDATVGPTSTDEEVVPLLRRTNKPVLLIANKVDSAMQESDAAALWSLGLGEPYPVSALHGRGSGDVLDRLVDLLPAPKQAQARGKAGPRRVALVGRPNVGKSSLLNQLAGENRVVVNDEAGTTRDPVDEIVSLDGRQWTFVDTAGIRRRVHHTRGADYYASLRTAQAIEKAELCLVLFDASVPLSEQDVRVAQQVVDARRALVIVANKWDLVSVERQEEFNRELERELVQLTWARRINISAKTGWHTNRLSDAMREALVNWERRITTARLNSFLGEVTAANPHPVRGGKQPRILFATQPQAAAPRFVIFASGFIEAGYRRFLENKLRETFEFTGTPLTISVRVRERRKR